MINFVAASYMWEYPEKDYKKAIEWLTKYYQSDHFEKDDLEKMRHWLACAYCFQKDNENYCKIALLIVSNDKFCSNLEYRKDHLKKLSDYFSEKKDIEQSKKYAQEAIKLWEMQIKEKLNNYQAYWEIACIYKYTLKENTKCIDYFQKASELNPQDSNIFANVGSACYDIKNYPDAIHYFNIAAELIEKKNDHMKYYVVAGLALSYLQESKCQDYNKAVFWSNKYLNYSHFSKDEQETLKNYLALGYFLLI